MPRQRPHIAILGSGPTGLEAALAAVDGGFPFTVYEASDDVAAHVRAWAHVRLFTPWPMNVSPRMARHLGGNGGGAPPEAVAEGADCPTGADLVRRLLRPLAELPSIAPRLELDSRVVAIGREGLLKHEEIGTPGRADARFRLVVSGADGSERLARADVVLDCTGTHGNPNATGSAGVPAPGERALGKAVVRRIPDLERDGSAWAGRRILLVGSGHSAQTAATALAALAREAQDTRVIWAVRRKEPRWDAAPDDPLPGRRRLAESARRLATGGDPAVECRTGRVVEALAPGISAWLRDRDGAVERIEVDRVLSLTGSVGDHALYRQLQVHECYATSGPMKLAAALLAETSTDCLDQTAHGPEMLRNPEPGFFILGEKSYGRNNTFLMRTGWQQVEDVFGLLA